MNVRISGAKMATLKHLSTRYDVSVSSIVSSLLAWAETEPEQRQDWFADVEALRQLIRENGCERQMIVEELMRDEWPGRREMCERLCAIGYIDTYGAISSRRDPSHIICSYKLSTSGWIIAKALSLEPPLAANADSDHEQLTLSTASGIDFDQEDDLAESA
ncbi:MAG TPA: hypothetical protein VFE16_02470 [Candidatus Cybelea sp.]|nr:hypothetical protein [Candidatus Cybelea sp.]